MKQTSGPGRLLTEICSFIVIFRDIFVIGDVHGCLDELKELLQKSKVNIGQDVIIFCGDIINKGPKSVETLRFIRSLPKCYSVRGNHEDSKLCDLRRLNFAPDIEKPNKKPTPQWIKELTDDEVEFLTELPYTISIPSLNSVIVHAGLVPNVPLHEQNPWYMVRMRNITMKNGAYIPNEKTDQGVAWASVWPGPEHVYFGHDAKRKLQKHCFATGLETGCLYGGLLTGVFITRNNEMVSVQAKQEYVISKKSNK